MRLFLFISGLLLSFTCIAQQQSEPKNMVSYDNYINAMIKDEKKGFIRKDSLIGSALKVISASEAINDYKANELKGNKKYKGKYVRIHSAVSAIKEGAFSKAYIQANGQNQFEYITIYINPDDERFLNISKGDKIDLICKGDGVLLGSPIFDKCYFPSDYADKMLNLLSNDITKNTFKTKEAIIISSMYYALEPIIESDCSKNEERCLKAVRDNINKISKEEFKKIGDSAKNKDRVIDLIN